jgi:hypothetical protein
MCYFYVDNELSRFHARINVTSMFFVCCILPCRRNQVTSNIGKSPGAIFVEVKDQELGPLLVVA